MDLSLPKNDNTEYLAIATPSLFKDEPVQPVDFSLSSNSAILDLSRAAEASKPVVNLTEKLLDKAGEKGKSKKQRQSSTPKRKPVNPGVKIKRLNLTARPGGRKDEAFGSISPGNYDVDQPSDKPSYYYEDVCGIEEKWPGKTCILCCHGEKSQLGQGTLLQLQATGPLLDAAPPENQLQPVRKLDKLKALLMNDGQTHHLSELQEELCQVGYLDRPDPTQLLDTSDLYYVHQACSTWCKGQGDLEVNLVRALQQVCSFCGRFGASISCRMAGCGKTLHFPCAVASGAFMDLRSTVAHCSEHIHQGSAMAGSAGVCYSCSSPGHVGNLVYCVTCGRHFHGSCVGISTASNVRTGWQCSECRTCVACRNSGEEMKMLVCDTCDKVYHPFCVKPLLSNIPKTGWKCKNCRICGDCGSRAPGAGPSSRWHSCFTVCDSCYQQRNKGACCPICGKAYRYSSKEMSMCVACRKYVHSSCDMEADRTICQRRRDVNPDYEYVCSVCKAGAQASYWSQSSCEMKGDDELDFSPNVSLSQESYGEDVFSEFDFVIGDDKSPRPLMRGKPFPGGIQRKRLGPSLSGPGRGFPRMRGTGRGAMMPFPLLPPKPGGMPELMRRRAFKGRMRSSFSGFQRSSSDNLKDEDTIGERSIVLFSATDEFVLNQDICVLCGCFGTDLEGRLIPCAQCGQCYHPYCAKIKLTKTMILKGWRCFDCTICEGCGMKNDEARLILCDECDISFHIYCTDPPLDYVPSGGWKCKWCTICQNCGSNDPGINGTWFNNFTLCAPCQSMTICPQCNFNHTEGDLVIQCSQCDRWSHGKCDGILTEQDAERMTADGYTCPLCRPVELTPSHVPSSLKGISPPSSPEPYRFKPSNEYFMDGVFLMENGMAMLRAQLPQEAPSKRGRGTLKKGRELEAWESGVGGQECGLDPGENEPAEDSSEFLKEGTVLSPKPDGRPPDIPDGYTLVPDNGKFIVKKKRQRNLQKLGIGGFQVRRPWARRDLSDEGFDGPLPPGMPPCPLPLPEDAEIKKKRLQKRKQKNKISENYPSYIQEAFFGKDMMGVSATSTKDGSHSSESDQETGPPPLMSSTITLSQENMSAIEAQKKRQGMADLVKQLKAEQEKSEMQLVKPGPSSNISQATVTTPPTSRASFSSPTKRDSDLSEDEGLHFDIPLPTDLDLDVDTLMNESDDLSRNSDGLDDPGDLDTESDKPLDSKVELSDIPSPHFSVDAIASEASLSGVDSKDVEDIFKGVLADDEAFSNSGLDNDSQTITLHGMGGQQFTQQVMSMENILKVDEGMEHAQMSHQSHGGHQDQQMGHQQLPFIHSFQGHWQQEQPNQLPQCIEQAEQQPINPPIETEQGNGGITNRRINDQKWEAEEALGEHATISAVLYANICQPDLKIKYPVRNERLKQISKMWRALPPDQKTPFLQKARENRSAVKSQRPPQSAQEPDNRPRRPESEQEQQWKQLQAARQLQAQQAASGAAIGQQQNQQVAIPGFAVAKGLAPLEQHAVRPSFQHQMEMRLQALQDPKVRQMLQQKGMSPAQIQQLIAQAAASQGQSNQPLHPAPQENPAQEPAKQPEQRPLPHDIDHDADFADINMDDEDLLGLGSDFNILDYGAGAENFNILDYTDTDLESHLTPTTDGTPKDTKRTGPPPSVHGSEQESLDDGHTVKTEGGVQPTSNPQMSGASTDIYAQPPPPYRPPPPYPGTRPKEEPSVLQSLLDQGPSTSHGSQENLLSPQQKPFFSDVDFEKLKADVLGGGSLGLSPPQLPGMGPNQAANQRIQQITQSLWQQNPQPPQGVQASPALPSMRMPVASQATPPQPTRQPIQFNLLPVPALPVDNPVTPEEKQIQMNYEEWLGKQQQLIKSYQTMLETEIAKFRKQKKSLNSRQRQARKNGGELNPTDAAELERVTVEQNAIQKQLESIRRQAKQHGMHIQDYQSKQQKRMALENQQEGATDLQFTQNLQQLPQTQSGPSFSGQPQGFQVASGQQQPRPVPMVNMHQVQRRPTPVQAPFQVPQSPQHTPMTSPSPRPTMPHQIPPQSPMNQMSQYPPQSPLQRSPMMQASPHQQQSPMHMQSPMPHQSPMTQMSPMQPRQSPMPYQQQSPVSHSPLQQMSPMQMLPQQSPLPHPSPLPEDSGAITSPAGASPYGVVPPSPSPNSGTSPYGNPAASPRLVHPAQAQLIEEANQRQGSPGISTPQRPPGVVRQNIFYIDQHGNRVPIPGNIDPSRINPAILQRFIRPIEGQRMRGVSPDPVYQAQGSPGQPIRLISHVAGQLRSPRPPMSPNVNNQAPGTPAASPGNQQFSLQSPIRRQSGDPGPAESDGSRSSGGTTPSEPVDHQPRPGLTHEQFALLQQRLIAAHNQGQVQRFAGRAQLPLQFQQRYAPPKSPGSAFQAPPKSPGLGLPPQSPMAPPQSPALRPQSPACYPQSPANMSVARSPAPQLVQTPLQSPQFSFSQQFVQSPAHVPSPRGAPPQSPVHVPAQSPSNSQDHQMFMQQQAALQQPVQVQQSPEDQYQQQEMHRGGGGRNPNILPAPFGFFGYFKPGLRGGAPFESPILPSSQDNGNQQNNGGGQQIGGGQPAEQPQPQQPRLMISHEILLALQQRRAYEAQQRAQAAQQQAQLREANEAQPQRFHQLSELLARPTDEPKPESSAGSSQLSELLAKPINDKVPPLNLNLEEKKPTISSMMAVGSGKSESAATQTHQPQLVVAQRTIPQVQGVVTPQMHRLVPGTVLQTSQSGITQQSHVQGHMPVQRPGPVVTSQHQQQASAQASGGAPEPTNPVSQLPQPSPSEIAANQLFLQQLLQKSQGSQQQAENLVRMISQQPPAIQSQMIQRIRAAMTQHQTMSVSQSHIRPGAPTAVASTVRVAGPQQQMIVAQGQPHIVNRTPTPTGSAPVRSVLQNQGLQQQNQPVKLQHIQSFAVQRQQSPAPQQGVLQQSVHQLGQIQPNTSQPVVTAAQTSEPLQNRQFFNGQMHVMQVNQRLQEQRPVNLQAQPVIMQKMLTASEIKKEVQTDALPANLSVKEEMPDTMASIKLELEDSLEGFEKAGDISDEKKLLDLEKRRAKRREYQQKRRQQAMLTREAGAESPLHPAGAPPMKKRPRKGAARQEEDYDVFIGGLATQVRRLAALTVTEPKIGRFSFNTLPHGSGDLNKLTFNFSEHKIPPWLKGDLEGELFQARIPDQKLAYETKPFGGSLSPDPPEVVEVDEEAKAKASTANQRGFYYQEFTAPRLGPDGYKRDYAKPVDRDTDTPDSVVSTSSPECVLKETVPQFPGLRVISEDEADESSDDLEEKTKRVPSPTVPLLAPVPIKAEPKPIKEEDEDKENDGLAREKSALQARFGLQTPPLRDTSNVTVTLTLNAEAAENITGVLGRLAALLGCAPPSEYEIVERTVTPPSQKVGLYRTKSKDGKEETVDVQSLLQGGNAKFCRHCDMVIIGEAMSKKTSDFPGLKWEQMWPNSPAGDELLFCGTTCYAQFSMTNKIAASSVKEGDLKEAPRTEPEVSKSSSALASIIGALTGDIDPKTLGTPQPPEGALEVPVPEASPSGENTTKKDAVEKVVAATPKKKQGKAFLTWSESFANSKKYKKPTENELMELLYRQAVCVIPPSSVRDNRKCLFCQVDGDCMPDGPGRLLNYDVDRWVHLNCALWAEDTYETPGGVLANVDTALKNCLNLTCTVCQQVGAAVKCHKVRCTNVYHIGCAVKEKAVFYKNKSVYCSEHASKGEKDEQLSTLAVFRRIVIQRDENRQVAAVMQHDEHHLFRVGSIVVLSVGQLLPHQLASFHTPHHIYPVGYKVLSIYWSFRASSRKCRYYCRIEDKEGRPYFSITVSEPEKKLEDLHFSDWTPTGAWQRILNYTEATRFTSGGVRFFPKYVSGEDLFGLTEPAIVRVLESLPGVESLNDYNFKYGRNPILELPLAVNPSGCARAEPKLRTHFKRVVQRAGTVRSQFALTSLPASESPYSKQFLHSKSSQYKKMKNEGRSLVYLARSKIQGLGLYALRDIEKHTMIIEYIGEIIRNSMAEIREKRYEAQNRGIYMFRIDEDRVVDASMSGGLARFINHSCNPNCTTELVEVDRELKIIIFANRRIAKGEELAYDYKFDLEDDKDKIPCLCGAPNCRKWMN